MFVPQILAVLLAVAFASASVASASADKGCGCGVKPVHRRHRRSSSSSSSADAGCGRRCSPADAAAAVLKQQAKFDRLVAECNYTAARAMGTADASFSLIQPGCMPNTCCLRSGTLAGLLSVYDCSDSLYTFYPTLDNNIRMFPNGTIVLTQAEVRIRVAEPSLPRINTYNYHWQPVRGQSCQFALSYIDGNNIQCPNFVLGALPCMPC